MNAGLADLLNLLELEQLEVNLFRGESRDVGSPQVFGGQVLGQALTAASATVSAGLVVHSLHAYFLRRGDFNGPIVYQVDRSLDGHSFCNRRVVAIQHGAQIFNMAASFQVIEQGLDHQFQMPPVPDPESLREPPPESIRHVSERLHKFFAQPRPFTFRLVEPPVGSAGKVTPRRQVWFKAVGRLPDEQRLHRCLLAYASDFFLLGTSILPHDPDELLGRLLMASLDHAVWFHRPLHIDDWLLYDMESPSASGARGFARACVFSRDGRLVATTAQEGLVRIKRGS
jgi:acyl-CoA thioesterase II